MAEFKLPDVGEGLTEAEIVSWKVKEGDSIEINDLLCEIETAKSIVELPSPFAGTVLRLMAAEGETVEVGSPIIAIGDPSDPAPSATSSEPSATGGSPEDVPRTELEIDLSNPAASGGGEGESLVGRNKVDRGPLRRARKGSASPSSEAGAQTQMQVQGAFSPGGAQSQDVASADEPPVPARSAEPASFQGIAMPEQPGPSRARALAKPPVRKLAKDLGLDLTRVRGSGPDGTVTREDVQAAAGGTSPGGTSSETSPMGGSSHDVTWGRAATGERESREPIKGVRKMMGQAMVDSAFSAPHVTEWITVDVTATVELVERLKTRRELREVRVGPLLVLARAAILAMRRTPEINSFWDEQAQEVVYKHYVNLGIAAATPRGLVVPNIKDAQDLSLPDLARALGELATTAREGRTQPAEMSGGTFTITNVGVFGVDAGTPIINPGESAILCFGAIRKQPWVVTGPDGDRIEPRHVTTLALSFDHRHVDGEKGSRFLADVAGLLEDPGTALLF